MKIIELLTLMAKGEKVPKKIKYAGEIFSFNDRTYVSEDGENLFSDMYNWLNDLSIKVEIIEEEKEIEKLPLPSFEEFKNMSAEERYLVTAKEYNVLHQIIDVINDMRDK